MYLLFQGIIEHRLKIHYTLTTENIIMKTTTITMVQLSFGGVSFLVLALLLAPAVSHASFAIEVNADTDVEVETSFEGNGSSSAGTRSNSNLDVGVGASESNSARSEATGSLEVNTNGTAVTSAVQMQSDVDFDVFRKNIQMSNKAVANIETNVAGRGLDTAAAHVSVAYKHSGRLFGFIPVTLISNTSVYTSEEGETDVQVRLPWWSAFVVKAHYAQTELETRIQNNATVSANAHADASAQAKAHVAEAMIAEIQAHIDAQASLNN